jgi:hypothetical protein
MICCMGLTREQSHGTDGTSPMGNLLHGLTREESHGTDGTSPMGNLLHGLTREQSHGPDGTSPMGNLLHGLTREQSHGPDGTSPMGSHSPEPTSLRLYLVSCIGWQTHADVCCSLSRSLPPFFPSLYVSLSLSLSMLPYVRLCVQVSPQWRWMGTHCPTPRPHGSGRCSKRLWRRREEGTAR